MTYYTIVREHDLVLSKQLVFKQNYRYSNRHYKYKVFNMEKYMKPIIVEHFLERFYTLNCTLPPYIKFGNYTYISDFIDYYIFWHNQVENDSSIKIICFEPTIQGLANKIFGMVSSLFFAMLTGRKFKSIYFSF